MIPLTVEADITEWMTMIENIRAAIKAATPLPWYALEAGDREWLHAGAALTSGPDPRNGHRVIAVMNANFPWHDDLKLIEAAVNAMPEFCDFVEASEKALRETVEFAGDMQRKIADLRVRICGSDIAVNRATIYAQIEAERNRQQNTTDADRARTHGAWIGLLKDHADRACKTADRDEWRHHMVVLASLAVAVIEVHDQESKP